MPLMKDREILIFVKIKALKNIFKATMSIMKGFILNADQKEKQYLDLKWHTDTNI